MKHERNKTFQGGFTLIEVVMALFVFTFLVSSTSMVYIEFLKAQKKAVSVQRRLENLQTLSNFVAKTARTSVLTYAKKGSNEFTNGKDAASEIILFDNSRSKSVAGNCMKLIFNPTEKTFEIQTSQVGIDSSDKCNKTTSFNPAISMTDSTYAVTGGFYFSFPTASSIGFLSVSFQACDTVEYALCSAGSEYSTKVQSSVSMR